MKKIKTRNLGLGKMLGLTIVWTLLFQASLLAQYCLPIYNNQCTSDDYINNVNFAGIVNNGSGCGTPGASNYTNYTATFTGNIVTNQPTPITVAPGPTWGQYFVAMIDINHDNDFADAGEFYDIGYSLGGGTVTNNITIPCNALTGITRLRIMCRYANTALTQADICNPNLSFGEVEDYNINITQPSNTNAALTKFISPITGCGLTATEAVTVRIKNVGGQTINGYTVCYRINNGAPICQTIVATILPCDSVSYTFPSTANLSTPATYDFDAYVTVAGDVSTANDTLSNHMVTNIPVIGSIPYSQNFDVTNGGWTTSGTASSWAWGAPAGTFINAAASAPNAWVTNLTGNYNTDELSYLTSPCFNLTTLTADPYIGFSQLFDIQLFGDLAYVELTTNAGATWNLLGNTTSGNNWYNNFSNAWDGTSGLAGAWRTADHQLTGAAGQAGVRLRFAFDSDAFGTSEGMGIDNVVILDTLKNTGALSLVSPLTGCQLGANETVTVALKNYGSHSVSNISVCYTINGGPAVCEIMPGPIAAGATVNYTFTSTANLSTVGNYNFVAYSNWAQDYTHLNDTTRITVGSLPVINTFPYRESFEASTGGWASGGTASNDWAWGTPAKTNINSAGAGTKCWVTAGLNTTPYQDNANNWVESPCFDLTTLTQPWVMLKAFWHAEFSWDGAVLESSTNGGNTWTQVGAFGDPFNWYNDNTIAGLSNFGATGEGWSGLGTGWLQTKKTISSLAGQSSVRFRIHFATDGSVTDDGFAFDDFIVADPPTVALGNDTILCGNLTLDPNLSGGTFAWSGPVTATTPTITATVAGTYILEYTDTLGLSASDTIILSASPTPMVNLGADQVICHGDSTCFTVNSSLYPSIIWGTGTTNSSICVSTAGDWNVRVIDAIGCSSTDTVSTTVVAIPTPNIGLDAALCPGDTICRGSNCGPNHTYIWNTGATTSLICINQAGGYWMQCIDSNGCAGADSMFVTQAASPVSIGSADTTNCPIVQFNSSSTGGITAYAWDFGDGNTATTANASNNYTAAGNGSYTVSLISTNSCGSDTTTFVVDINCLVSIGNAIDNQIKIFPNPNRGQFKLETTLSGTAPVLVSIVDLHGKVVYAHDFGQIAGRFAEQIDLDVARGVYFVRMDVGGQVTVRKLVLQ